MDPTYALAEKILPDGDLKPQAKQLQSRVDYLLRLLARKYAAKKAKEQLSRQKPNSKGNSKDRNGDPKSTKAKDPSKKKGEKKKDKIKDKKKKKKDKKRPSRLDPSGPAFHFQANSAPAIIGTALDTSVFELCKEKMRPVKKSLKLIGNPNLSKEKERECLLKIGERIRECLNELSEGSKSKEWRNNLWTFVSEFTEFSGKRLYRMYKSAIENGISSPPHHHSSSTHRHDNNSHSHKDKMKRPSDPVSPSPSKRPRGDFGYRDSHGYPSGGPGSSHPPPIPTQSSSRQGSSGASASMGGNNSWQPRAPSPYMHSQRGLPFHQHPSMIPPPPSYPPPYGPYPHPPPMSHMNNFGPRNRNSGGGGGGGGGGGSGNHQRRMNDRPHDRGPLRQ